MLPKLSIMSATHSMFVKEDDPLAIFRTAISNINFRAIPEYILRVRKSMAGRGKTSESLSRSVSSERSMKCRVAFPPLYGSYNILYPIEFSDGAQWLLKVPATGFRGRFNEADGRELRAEALIMRLLKRETSIPVPEIFDYQASPDNELNCAFILMEFIDGEPLPSFWFDDSYPTEIVEQRRARVLQDVASAMVQLNRFRFQKGGSIIFDDEGNPQVGPLRTVDFEDPEEPPEVSETGPFDTQKDFYYSKFAQSNHTGIARDKSSLGLRKLLGLFFDWIPYNEDLSNGPFVLTHPDLDIQNIIVSRDGRVAAIIDWDGVAAEPAIMGSERYPSWLTRDWDPMMYGYISTANVINQHSEDEDGVDRSEKNGSAPTEDENLTPESVSDGSLRSKENSPEELARYRKMYECFIAGLAAKSHEHSSFNATNHQISTSILSTITEKLAGLYQMLSGKSLRHSSDPQLTNHGDGADSTLVSQDAARLTRNSLMIESLSIAASNEMCWHSIMLKIFDEIARVAEGKFGPLVDGSENGSRSENENFDLYEDGKFEQSIAPVREEFKSAPKSCGLSAIPVIVIDEASPRDDDAPIRRKLRDEEVANTEHDLTNERRKSLIDADLSDNGDFDWFNVALALADGKLDEARLQRLKSGFAALCS